MSYLKFPVILFVLLALPFVSCTAPTNNSNDAGTVPESTKEAETKTIPCGDKTCPSDDYICCNDAKDAPPVCCLKGLQACYKGGGIFTGWPEFNGCSAQKCQEPNPKHCPESTSGACCKNNQECVNSQGYAYCKDENCPADRECYGAKICCSKPGICQKFRTVEFCAEDCAAKGMEKCSLEGNYYGDEEYYQCCPKGTCQHHPDGWPFCLNIVY